MTLERRSQVLFNPGPVNLDAAIRENLFNVELSHRQPEFDELLSSVKERLHRLLGIPAQTHALSLLHGSGSLAVDAALTSFVGGDVVVVDNGLYSERFSATLAGVTGTRVRAHAPGLGRPADLDKLAEELDRQPADWLAVVHHETTTGLLNTLDPLVSLATERGSRLFVDAVSSIGAHPVPPADVVCFNGNKCLESLPGVAGVFWARDLEQQPTTPVLDVSSYADGIPNTPNVQAVMALDIALDLMEGENRPARYERLARRVWETGSRSFEPLLPEQDRSHVLTAFKLGGRDPDELFRTALANGFVIYHGQRELRDRIFRIANMGVRIDEDTIDALFEAIGR